MLDNQAAMVQGRVMTDNKQVALAGSGSHIHFVQVQRSALKSLRDLSRKNPRAAELVMWMAETMDRRGALVASRKTMGRALGVSEATVKRALKVLVDERWVQRISLGAGTVSAYAVNARVAWAGSREKLTRLAYFQASVVAHLDDQDETALLDDPLKTMPEIIPPELATIEEDEPELPEDQLSLPNV